MYGQIKDTSDGINGDYLVEDVEIEIGGQRIDKQYQAYWNHRDYINNTRKIKSRRIQIFNRWILNTLVTDDSLDAVGGTSQQSIMYPLQFWFVEYRTSITINSITISINAKITIYMGYAAEAVLVVQP